MSILRYVRLGLESDSYIDANNATTNYGTTSVLKLGVVYASGSKVNRYRMLLRTTLPIYLTASNIAEAHMYLYCGYCGSSAKAVTISRVTTAHVESEETWNKASASVNWTTAGGDYTATGAVTDIMPTGAGWWAGASVSSLVTDAISNRSRVLDLHYMYSSENPGSTDYSEFVGRTGASTADAYLLIGYYDTEMDTGAII